MLRIFTIMLLAAATAAQAQDEVKATLKVLNTYRKACGLKPVTVSARLSAGCAAHLRYLELNKGHEKTQGLEAHNEYKDLPGYSMEGEIAGRKSVICFTPLVNSVADFFATFYHRMALLQHNLLEVGMATNGHMSLINCISGTDGKLTTDVVLCPGENQQRVQLYLAPELPDPVPATADPNSQRGYPVTFYFCRAQTVRNVVFRLTDDKHRPVACYLSTPEEPATSFMQWNTVCAIPVHALAPGTRYTASLQCTVNDKPYSKVYSFTTMK